MSKHSKQTAGSAELRADHTGFNAALMVSRYDWAITQAYQILARGERLANAGHLSLGYARQIGAAARQLAIIMLAEADVLAQDYGAADH